MDCKTKESFHLDELISDIEKTGLSKKEQILFKFFQRDTEDIIVERMRDLYYFYGIRKYDDWLEDEMCARTFWHDVKDAAEEDEWTVKIKLTPDDREALEDARLGDIGRELFAAIVTWFFDHGFIRGDITVWNCRVFRYLDAYLMTKENIIMGIFRHYEDIRDIDEINEEVMEYFEKSIPSRILRILKKEIDVDEEEFKNNLSGAEHTQQEKELVKIVNCCLKPHAEIIYKIVFSA